MSLPTKKQEQGETPKYEASMHSKKFLAAALRAKKPEDQKAQPRSPGSND